MAVSRHISGPALRRGMVAGAMCLALVAPAACSTQRQVAGQGGAEKCQGSTKVQEQIAQVWHEDQRALGVPQLDPPEQHVCVVDTSKYKKKPPYRIAFASQGPTNSWAVEYDAALRHEAHGKNVKVLYASANGDVQTQVGNLQDLLVQKPDALVVTPMGSAIQGQLHRYAQQNIPVVVCTGKLSDTKDFVTTVNRSYALQGTLWAQWVVKQIHGKGQIAMLSGIAGVPTAEYTYRAAMRVFNKHPGIKIVTHEYTNWSPTQAKKVASTLLVKYPHLDAIWSDSSFNIIGAIKAYAAAGKHVPPITGDTVNGMLRLAKDTPGLTFATSPYPPEQSAQCLDAAVKILQGKRVPSRVNVNAPVFTDKQADKYYRTDCTDNLWIPARLPNHVLKKLKLC